MQRDMHYSAVYVLARLAGIKRESAQLIAKASEFVDDSRESKLFKLPTGHRVDIVTTAHAPVNVKNILSSDQRYIWVPFHFIPGNLGETVEERMICRKDSEIAKSVLERYFEEYHKERFGLQYLGIALHIYMDTFSHYGFSGIKSDSNHIQHSDIEIINRDEINQHYQERFQYYNGLKKFFTKIGHQLEKKVESVAEIVGEKTGAIGHSAAGHLPDFPYMSWRYKTLSQEKIEIHERNNTQDYLEACEKVFEIFLRFRKSCPEMCEEQIITDFNSIKSDVLAILSSPGRLILRIRMWKELLEKYSVLSDETVDWKARNLKLAFSLQLEEMMNENLDLGSLVLYQFYQAAHLAQVVILRRILPSHELYVV